ncbi:MAG: class I SAM-dependent methyltransferase [Patescibacteria group bacterium]|nr:class I SAM-dependent methyltransferase [Patescibacteria group bacterium]
MNNLNLISQPWPDYELLDSGDNRKLERFGKFTIVRPEAQALWNPSRPELWKQAVAEFKWSEGKGKWHKKKEIPDGWRMSWDDLAFAVRLTSFKHTGIFPEQAENWRWIQKMADDSWPIANPKILNLFGYTGVASIVAAKTGANVVHVDASRQSNAWAKENAELSGIAAGSIKFLLEDALKFAEREARRGSKYGGIILDPPAFGRGPKGEVWRIEEHLPQLLAALSKLLDRKSGSFFLLNGYAAGYSPQSYLQAAESRFDPKNTKGEFGELAIRESSGRILPQGIYVRFCYT